MGQRGKAPAPRALQLLKGETRPSRLKTAPGPQVAPDRPDDLTADAAAVWDRVMAAIADSAHIGPRHAETFAQFCEAVAAARAMKPKGTKEWRELVNVSTKLARELCLTPATGANLGSKAPVRKLDKYLAG